MENLTRIRFIDAPSVNSGIARPLEIDGRSNRPETRCPRSASGNWSLGPMPRACNAGAVAHRASVAPGISHRLAPDGPAAVSGSDAYAPRAANPIREAPQPVAAVDTVDRGVETYRANIKVKLKVKDGNDLLRRHFFLKQRAS